MKHLKAAAAVGLMACTLMANTLPAQGQDPKAILMAASRAGKDLKSVRYSTEMELNGGPVRATVTEVRADVPGGGMVVRAKYLVSGFVDGDEFRYAYDGKAIRIADPRSGRIRVVENPSDGQLGQLLGMYPVVTMPLLGGSFDTFATTARLAHKGVRKVGKWTCDLIEIKRKVDSAVLGEVELTSYFAFDRATHLPVQVGNSPDRMKTVTHLELNPTVPDSIFRFEGKEVKSTGAEAAVADLLPIGSKAPAFSLRDGTGRTRTLAEFRGKVVLLDFWGTWCLPCHKMMPKLQALSDKLRGKGLVVLGVSVADREADPVKFMKRKGYRYQILLNGDATAKLYKAIRLPTLYLIDRQGKIVYRQSGLSLDGEAGMMRMVERVVTGR